MISTRVGFYNHPFVHVLFLGKKVKVQKRASHILVRTSLEFHARFPWRNRPLQQQLAPLVSGRPYLVSPSELSTLEQQRR